MIEICGNFDITLKWFHIEESWFIEPSSFITFFSHVSQNERRANLLLSIPFFVFAVIYVQEHMRT